jgi:acyl dehydratase
MSPTGASATQLPEAAPRALAQRDFDRFALLSHDDAPIHVDPDFARTTHFGATVAQAMFLYGLVSAALSRRLAPSLPAGWLPAALTLAFPTATYVGDTVTVVVEPHGEGLDAHLRNQRELVTAQAFATVLDARRGYPGGSIDDSFNRTDLESDPELYGLSLGESASASRSFSADDLDDYVDLTGDSNPPVASRAAAIFAGLPDRLVPGPLLGGMLSDLLGTRLPGRGTGWIRQRLAFHSAAHPGERLAASVTVTGLQRDKQLVDLGCLISGDDGRPVVTGAALVLVRNLAR